MGRHMERLNTYLTNSANLHKKKAQYKGQLSWKVGPQRIRHVIKIWSYYQIVYAQNKIPPSE